MEFFPPSLFSKPADRNILLTFYVRNLNGKSKQEESNWHEQKSLWMVHLSQLARLPTAETQHAISYYTVLTRNELLFRLHISSWCYLNTILIFSTRLEDWRHPLWLKKMNVFAFVVFLSSIPIMLRPTHVEGEFENVLTFKFISFKSRFILSYFLYPNTHQLPGLASRTLRHKRVGFVVDSTLRPLHLVDWFSSGYSGFPLFIKADIFKFQFDQESERHRFVNGEPVTCYPPSRFNSFIQLEFAKITQNWHVKIFSGKNDAISL
jgi:hypothetical protein